MLLQEHRNAASSALTQLEAQQDRMASLEAAAAKATAEVQHLQKHEAELEQQITKLTGGVPHSVQSYCCAVW